ncbi:MAG: hypothetical protein BGO82_10335 [Devosia sp. 67-54]|uniref:autotransporter outer membrane beta-barrel domain-containing protein n=1 Tax=unclassified Devosia TaxID=196773 RepID=UPI00096A08F4|nr:MULTISPECIES: autotransporter outer membrane beta-barrel domain-containing protein [unclassified Devosia]MBN9304968.1 autotransporter outer membrane beta-barrel domain-containing protein [Devosia sp.]OJX15088.1 MAG: hypothetical protein BGO82_10335 [Devosia sp. 67-54]
MSATASFGQWLSAGAISAVALLAATGSGAAATLAIDAGDAPGAIDLQTYAGGPYDGFDNSGYVDGGSATGIASSQSVGLVYNRASGTIRADNAGESAVFDGDVTTFINDGEIDGGHNAIVGINGRVGSFINNGTLKMVLDSASGGVYLAGGVDSFLNSASGIIDVNPGPGTSTGVYSGGDVGSFSNLGHITSNQVGVEFANYVPLRVGSFYNGGTIYGATVGTAIYGSVGDYANSGEIAGGDDGAYFNGAVGSFANSGQITSTGGSAVRFDDEVDSFANLAGGSIVGALAGVQAYNYQPIHSFTNAGYISGGYAGVMLDGITAAGTTFVNTGTIEGPTGVLYFVDADGREQLINSGIIRSLTNGTAIDFDCGCGDYDRADTLTILTGSRIFGAVNFGSESRDVHDTLDFSGYFGSTVLTVPGLDVVVPGIHSYAWDRPNDRIAIFDISAMGGGAFGDLYARMSRDIAGLAETKLGHALTSGPAAAPLGFAPQPSRSAAETAVLSELDVRQPGIAIWGGTIGGASNTGQPLDVSGVYGGLVAGAHVRLSQALTLGGLAGYVDSANGQHGGVQSVVSRTVLAGVYGQTSLGAADLDLALLAGASSHAGTRQVSAPGGIETASTQYSSLFVAPSLAVSLPVSSTDVSTLLVKASLGYVGGFVSGYSETGSSMSLTVGQQGIGLLDARLGLEGRRRVTAGDGVGAELVARGGVFATANFGGANVPVTVLGQTVSVSSAASSAGVYAGAGIDSRLGPALTLSLHGDGAYRADGLVSGSLKATLGGTF